MTSIVLMGEGRLKTTNLTPPPLSKLKLSFAMSWQNPSLLTYKHNHLLSLSKTLVQTTLKKTLKLASTKVMIHIISSFFFLFFFKSPAVAA